MIQELPNHTPPHVPAEGRPAGFAKGLLEESLFEIHREVLRAEALHPPINSAHEGYAVILEELEEYWEQVKRRLEDRDPEAMHRELVQTAAMCLRTIRDVLGQPSPTG